MSRAGGWVLEDFSETCEFLLKGPLSNTLHSAQSLGSGRGFGGSYFRACKTALARGRGEQEEEQEEEDGQEEEEKVVLRVGVEMIVLALEFA